MKVEVEINPKLEEDNITIKVKELSDEVKEIVDKINNIDQNDKLIVMKNEKVYVLEIRTIVSIYASQGKVFIKTETEEYQAKRKLYELEDFLQTKFKNFIRISNSEIINFDMVENLDLSITGTIEIKFKNGYTTYVSRRNIKKIKKYLNI